MSQIQLYVDPTGKMSQEEVNAQNIEVLMNEWNRSQSTSSQLITTQTAETAYDGTNNKAVFGFQNGLQQWGLFVGKNGVDTLNTTNLNDFIFNSNQNVFKIVKSGTISIPAINANTSGAQYAWNTIPFTGSPIVHNLGYIPAVVAFEATSNNYQPVGIPLIWTASPSAGFIQAWTGVSVTSVNLSVFVRWFGYNSSATIGGWTVKYYLLQEAAS